MKAPLAALGLFVLTAALHAAPTVPPPSDPASLTSWFSELGTRREGSPSEAVVFAALRTWFAGTKFEEAGFDALEGEHSFSRRLWFRVPGPAAGELVVVTPTDGANDRGLAWAVTWALKTLRNPPAVSVTFLFTGAERGAGDSAGMGSRAFLQDFYPTVPAAAVYLDARPSASVELTTESGLFPSPLWMVRGATEAFQKNGLSPTFPGTAPSLFRLDLPERRNALAPWFERSIPALLVSAGPDSTAVVDALETFLASMKNGMPRFWDRHYLVFDLGFTKFFWGQGAYLLLFLTVAALLLFGYAVAGRGHRGSLTLLWKDFWQLPLLFALVFLAFYAATALAGALQNLRGVPDFWKAQPLLTGFFKLLTAVALSLVLFVFSGRSPLSRNPDFYGQAALLWLGLMVVAAAGLELTFSFYFLWALFWCAVLVVFRWPALRLVAISLGPLWLAKAAWDVLGPQPDLPLSEWVLHSPVAGNFALTLLLFPFFLQVNAWHHSGRSERPDLRARVQLAVTVVAALALGVAVLRAPADGLPLTGLKPVAVDLRQNPRPELWKAAVRHAAFLDRTVWTIEFRGADPEQIEFTLSSTDELTIFDCSFPVTLAPSGNQARIIVGRQPSLPLQLRLTLPASTKAQLHLKALFAGTPGTEITDTVDLQ